MISQIFNQYQYILNNCSGTTVNFKEQISGTLWIEAKITSITRSPINPNMNVNNTKFTITSFDKSGLGRVAGIDNHENKPLHGHTSGTEFPISGSYNLGEIGSKTFLGFF